MLSLLTRSGRGRCLLAFSAGLLAAFAFPPFNVVPLFWLSFPALFFLTKKAETGRQAFAAGWCFSFGLLVICLYWIAGALFVDIGKFLWVLPFALAGLPAFFALYYGVAAFAAWRWGLARAEAPFLFAFCWFLADMARGHFLTGFPWDMSGYVWGDFLPILQSTSVIGIEGLSLLTLLFAFAPASFLATERKKAVATFAFFAVLFFGIADWGSLRLHEATAATVQGVRFRLVQPATDQALKWKAEHRFANLEKLIALSAKPAQGASPTHIVWPETATAYYLAEEPNIRRMIARVVPSNGVLLTGVVRRQRNEGDGALYFNSLVAIDSKANILGGYDKHHLVPFGEYMPFRSILPLPVISMMGTDFTPGEGVRTMRAPGLPPFGPLVCYEAIFPNEVASRDDPPRFLLNVTNDAWYEGTIGPAQHFVIARVRAIEEGLPLVRVANKGITGIVDPWGRIAARIGSEEEGFLDCDLPEALKFRTFLSEYGNKPFWLMVSALFLLYFVLFVRTANFCRN